MTSGSVAVVARDCIKQLLLNDDADKMIVDVLIAEPLLFLVWKIVLADKAIDLLHYTTWNRVNFKPLRRGLVKRIALAFANN